MFRRPTEQCGWLTIDLSFRLLYVCVLPDRVWGQLARGAGCWFRFDRFDLSAKFLIVPMVGRAPRKGDAWERSNPSNLVNAKSQYTEMYRLFASDRTNLNLIVAWASDLSIAG